jgi:uncharacterized damage-inducible protein DinB
MEFKDFILRCLHTSEDMILKAVDGLSREELARRPNDQSNSIGWTLWHLARLEDVLVVDLIEQKPQLWIANGWYKKFGRAEDRNDHGFRHTAQDVAAFQVPEPDVLVGYFKAVRGEVKSFLGTFSNDGLEQPAKRWGGGEGTVKAGNYLTALVDEALAHGGQIAYLRGLYRGMGWYQ